VAPGSATSFRKSDYPDDLPTLAVVGERDGQRSTDYIVSAVKNSQKAVRERPNMGHSFLLKLAGYSPRRPPRLFGQSRFVASALVQLHEESPMLKYKMRSSFRTSQRRKRLSSPLFSLHSLPLPPLKRSAGLCFGVCFTPAEQQGKEKEGGRCASEY